MRDGSPCTVLSDTVLQGLEDLVERAVIAVRIKAAEALVDKDCVEADVAADAFDDVGKAEGESQGRDERLAPGKGGCRALAPGVGIIDGEPEAAPGVPRPSGSRTSMQRPRDIGPSRRFAASRTWSNIVAMANVSRLSSCRCDP